MSGFSAALTQAMFDAAVAKIIFTKGITSYADAIKIASDANHSIVGTTAEDERAKLILEHAIFTPHSLGEELTVSLFDGATVIAKVVTGFASATSKIKGELATTITAMVVDKTLPVKYTKLPSKV